MTAMEAFFDSMKHSAKYAVVAGSLASMLVTGFPGAAQAQVEGPAVPRTEMSQVEKSYIAGKEMGDFRGSVNVLAKADTTLKNSVDQLQNAHNRLIEQQAPGSATAGWVMRGGYVSSSHIDLSQVRDAVVQTKAETGVDLSVASRNMSERLELVGKMESALQGIANSYNARDAVALKQQLADYTVLSTKATDLQESAAVKFLRPATRNVASQEMTQEGDLKDLAQVDRNVWVSLQTLERAVLTMARNPDKVHTHESLLTNHKEYTAAKDISLDHVREVAKQVKTSGVDVDGIVKNIEQRVDLVGRMESKLDAIIKDYYSNDGQSLAKNLQAFDMEAVEHARLMQDTALDALHPSAKPELSSITMAHGRMAGNANRSFADTASKVYLTYKAVTSNVPGRR
jgi:hypothetical protein